MTLSAKTARSGYLLVGLPECGKQPPPLGVSVDVPPPLSPEAFLLVSFLIFSSLPPLGENRFVAFCFVFSFSSLLSSSLLFSSLVFSSLLFSFPPSAKTARFTFWSMFLPAEGDLLP